MKPQIGLRDPVKTGNLVKQRPDQTGKVMMDGQYSQYKDKKLRKKNKQARRQRKTKR